MKMFKKIRAIIITCFLGMVIALCSYTASVHAESSSVGKLNNGTENILTKHLRVKVTFGYNGYVKYGDNMPVRAEIYNKSSSSYKGIFRIVYRNNEKIPMIQKKFSDLWSMITSGKNLRNVMGEREQPKVPEAETTSYIASGWLNDFWIIFYILKKNRW